MANPYQGGIFAAMERWRELGAAGALAAAVLAGCGGGTRQDAHEASGTYKVQVVSASFPAKQHVSQPVQMDIVVRNAGSSTIPDLAVTVDSFNRRTDSPTAADPTRPIWIVDSAPSGGDSAYNNTWALGPLAAGQSRTFSWRVTAVDAGRFNIKYSIAAGLNGKAVAQLEDGSAPQGNWAVAISRRPAATRVDPNTGRIVRPHTSRAPASGGAPASAPSDTTSTTPPPPGY
ncbi:MAG: hypothetical protein NVS3B18_16430 [Candidatus Dormibacteria bacterium]